MADDPAARGVAEAMRAINQAWLQGRVDDMAPALHPEIVMVFPGFSGQIRGREPFLAGFRDFVQSAKVHEFNDHDQQIDIVGDTGVIVVPYEMLHTRSGDDIGRSAAISGFFRNKVRRGSRSGGR